MEDGEVMLSVWVWGLGSGEWEKRLACLIGLILFDAGNGDM
jgi:hypothetical protein